MSWCDRLSSTPAAGFRLTPNFNEAGFALNSIQSILNELHEGDKATFTTEFVDAFEVRVNTESGFLYSISPFSISVTFNHRMRAQPTSAGLPVMELLSRPAPYTVLLDELLDKLIKVMVHFPHQRDRGINRVGIVSRTSVDFNDAPPGIPELFENLGRPFGGALDELSGSFGVKLSQSTDFEERCVHELARPMDQKKLITVNLDWQRTFLSPKVISRSRVEDILHSAKDAALIYFERVAEGGLGDAQI